MAASNALTNTLQVIEQPASISSITAQALLASVSTNVVTAVSKQIVLGPPNTTTTVSNTLQVIEANSPEISSVTAQVLLAPISNTITRAVSKSLVLQAVTSVQVSNVTLEVIGASTFVPPKPGQRVTWFNS